MRRFKMPKRSDQMKIIDIIVKRNPKVSVGAAAKVYKLLKELGR